MYMTCLPVNMVTPGIDWLENVTAVYLNILIFFLLVSWWCANFFNLIAGFPLKVTW